MVRSIYLVMASHTSWHFSCKARWIQLLLGLELAHYMIVCVSQHKNNICTGRPYNQYDFSMIQITKWLKNSLNSMLIKGAAILDCKLWVVKVPLTS